MHHLSALDALFLHMETPDMPMHVGGLILLDKTKKIRGSFYKKIREHMVSRMHLAPLFSRRLAFMPLDLVNPIWLSGAEVDLDYHIQHKLLPKPGTQAQLEALVAELHEGMLDRDRPLWQFTVIEGLQSGQVAFASRIHHAALDGQGGVALAQAMFDTEPTPRAVESAEEKTKRLPPSTAKMLSAAFRNTVSQYGKILRAVPEAVKVIGKVGAMALSASQAKKAGAPSEQGTGIPELLDFKPGDSPEKAAKSLLKKIPGGIKLGPRTPFNVAISGKRAFVGLQISLAETKLIAKHFDAKLNDIVMAVVAGALRRYFAKDAKVLAKSMIGAIPVSLRAAGDTTQSNQVTMMLVNMATQIAEPTKRLKAIIEASTKAKALTGSMKSVMPTDMPSLGLPWLLSIISPLYKLAVSTNRIPVVANIVISNVPGPPVALYLAGAKMTANFPVSIVTHGLGLNVTIQSYNGSLDYGLIACKRTVPKLREFADAMGEAHRELLALVNPIVVAPKKTRTAAKAVPKAKAKPAVKKVMRTTVKPTTRTKKTG
jgi:diacylglycerol O-acyltransferase / wax synthase